jgi:hypothetical protein
MAVLEHPKMIVIIGDRSLVQNSPFRKSAGGKGWEFPTSAILKIVDF